jgi:glycosyltransferase involved in cell wall biosynthesis
MNWIPWRERQCKIKAPGEYEYAKDVTRNHEGQKRWRGSQLPAEESNRRITVLPELRASQVADQIAGPPGEVIYLSKHYDLQGTVIPSTFTHLSVPATVMRLLSSHADVLEVPEPLWARFLPTNLLFLVAWRISGILHGHTRKVRSYAIENNNPESALFGRRSSQPIVRTITLSIIGVLIRSSFERLAFGSDGARANYESIPGVNRVPRATFLELPSPTPGASLACGEAIATFIGRLEPRKGVPELMLAWQLVESAMPNAKLVVIGDGILQSEVTIWCGARPSSRIFVGQVEHATIPDHLRKTTVVVAPSRREGRWREQIGLPIIEGLAEGKTIVTTDETGLADWLQSHNHVVVSLSSSVGVLGAAIIDALTSPLSAAEVKASLPANDGRYEAARWLLTG